MLHGALRDGRRRGTHAPSTRFSFICSRPTAWPKRSFAVGAAAAQGPSTANLDQAGNHEAHNAAVSKKRSFYRSRLKDRLPASQQIKAHEFLKHLEAYLPPHLRSDVDASTSGDTDFTPSAPELAQLLLETDGEINRESLVTWLAVYQGRWKAAVWVVKLLVEHFHAESPRSHRLSNVLQKWNRTESLDDLTEQPLYMVDRSGEPPLPHIKTSSAASLHELTDDKPDNLSSSELLRHNILGLIWRDIGRMIITCANNADIAGGEVKPDVLEMIALLHHYELMPASIYAYVPAESEDAIQQPPTLHLLSSRIFTALSDATWRAREMSAVEEAKRKGGELMGLEAKGSSYRVRVSGIKPEIWLELILWSCLHGGWIQPGVSLLGSLFRHESSERWKPISWRDSLSAIIPFGQKNLLDWDSIKYMFDTRSNATMDNVDIAGLRVDKTVSSEVVNAYVDAILNTAHVGVGNRGVSAYSITRSILMLRQFLGRAGLNLGGGTWDAMMLRLVESGAIDVERTPEVVRHLIKIPPKIGQELRSRRSQEIPAYVLDGSAAVLGLLHRALYAEIRNGNLDGALSVFKKLQERVDADRNQSLDDFFSHKHLSTAASAITSKGMFTGNFTGIEYPSFSTQIPPTTLAAFLELVIENKAFDFGNWMVGIDNTDVDGPIIPPSLYSDPHISAAIVHFAIATRNTALLSKISQLGAVQGEGTNVSKMPNERVQAFFNAQVEMRRWDAAESILDYMHETEGYHWTFLNAAYLGKSMILEESQTAEPPPPSSSSSPPNRTRAQAMFRSMLMGRHRVKTFSHGHSTQLTTLCVILASVSPNSLAGMNPKLPNYFNFKLGKGAFNQIIEGVVAANGSQAGRELVDKLLIADALENPQSVESSRKKAHHTNDPASMPRFLRDALEAGTLPRTTIDIPASATGKRKQRTIAMYGRAPLWPSTTAIVVRQALKEHKQWLSTSPSTAGENRNASDSPSMATFVWALHTLRRGRLDRDAIWAELETALSHVELQVVYEKAAEAWKAYGRKQGWTEKKTDKMYREEEAEEDEEEGRDLDAFDRQAELDAKL